MKRITISVVAWLVLSASASAAIVRVDPGATGTGDGSSWANAKTDLNDAIFYAPPGDEVWVIAGTYTAIVLKNQVKVYGGFAGTETLASQSAPAVSRTYLVPTLDESDLDSTTVLRGFWIIDGSTGGDYLPGAGMKLTDCDMAVIDCVFENNSATGVGGALGVYGGSPTFINCKFLHNDAVLGGAAVVVRDAGSPIFINSLFADNEGMEGGAFMVLTGSAQLVNCTVADNIANVGGGGALSDYPRSSVIRNGIIWGNDSQWAGTKAVYSTPGNTGEVTATYSDVQGGWTGAGNIDADPNFVDSVGGNFRLLPSAPPNTPVDTGDNAQLPADDYDLDWDGDFLETIPLDLGGAPRIQGGTVDMGAYEGIAAVVSDDDPSNPDTGDGSIVRFISLEPVNAGDMTALRVTLTNLPSPFTSFNGTTMWVGAPATVCHNQTQTSPPCSNPSSGFEASRLSCTPHYRDWSTISTLYIYDDEIVPGAVYDVQAIHQGWDTGHEENYSNSLTINTSVWGDVTGGFDSGTSTWTPPDGSVDMTTDYTAVLDKFSGVPGAPHKARCDLDPNVPDRLIAIADIIAVINAYNGVAYPYDGPTVCP